MPSRRIPAYTLAKVPAPASRVKAGGCALAAIAADVTWTRTAAGRRLRPQRLRPSLLPQARARAKVVKAARAKARARRSSTGYAADADGGVTRK